LNPEFAAACLGTNLARLRRRRGEQQRRARRRFLQRPEMTCVDLDDRVAALERAIGLRGVKSNSGACTS
jgi:hypothetical protein